MHKQYIKRHTKNGEKSYFSSLVVRMSFIKQWNKVCLPVRDENGMSTLLKECNKNNLIWIMGLTYGQKTHTQIQRKTIIVSLQRTDKQTLLNH